ncbi:hypothetical protein Pmani_034199 [Petrolisthes manimaculis]|uniref:Uncharacterized protein n=1 Tax=Petrolisthes manimaculis TaxID=1843537 RepID=A0AAE1NPS3_9EUCA|nr:hypothetical protein Pmani_034199 [Petrolisthes manimaculis]
MVPVFSISHKSSILEILLWKYSEGQLLIMTTVNQNTQGACMMVTMGLHNLVCNMQVEVLSCKQWHLEWEQSKKFS